MNSSIDHYLNRIFEYPALDIERLIQWLSDNIIPPGTEATYRQDDFKMIVSARHQSQLLIHLCDLVGDTPATIISNVTRQPRTHKHESSIDILRDQQKSSSISQQQQQKNNDNDNSGSDTIGIVLQHIRPYQIPRGFDNTTPPTCIICLEQVDSINRDELLSFLRFDDPADICFTAGDTMGLEILPCKHTIHLECYKEYIRQHINNNSDNLHNLYCPGKSTTTTTSTGIYEQHDNPFISLEEELTDPLISYGNIYNTNDDDDDDIGSDKNNNNNPSSSSSSSSLLNLCPRLTYHHIKTFLTPNEYKQYNRRLDATALSLINNIRCCSKCNTPVDITDLLSTHHVIDPHELSINQRIQFCRGCHIPFCLGCGISITNIDNNHTSNNTMTQHICRDGYQSQQSQIAQNTNNTNQTNKTIATNTTKNNNSGNNNTSTNNNTNNETNKTIATNTANNNSTNNNNNALNNNNNNTLNNNTLNNNNNNHSNLLDKAHNVNLEQTHQKCPKCNIFVIRTEACSHMRCHCGEQFCYQCGKRWDICKSSCGITTRYKNERDVYKL